MKHKYVFSKDTDTGQLLIREFAELNKDIFSPVCETFLEAQRLENALAQGPMALMMEMRTQNFFPPSSFCEKIVLGISNLISSDGQEMIEIFCNDADFLTVNLDGQDAFEDVGDEQDDTLDEFIEEDLPDTFNNDVKKGSANSPKLDIEDDVLDEDEG